MESGIMLSRKGAKCFEDHGSCCARLLILEHMWWKEKTASWECSSFWDSYFHMHTIYKHFENLEANTTFE